MVYFGNNARDQKATPVYGLLASYDDEMFTSFWQELELGPDRSRVIPISEDTQPLEGPREAPPVLVKMLRQEGLTIIIVEHVMDAIRSLCDRCVVMNAGRIIAEGPPAAVLADREVIRAYLGEPDA